MNGKVSPALKPKWRPALWMVVFGVFMLVALLPLAGLLLIILLEHLFGFSFELRTLGGLLSLALGSMVMGLIIGAIFLRALLRPLQSLIERTGEIDAGRPNAFRPLDYGGTQEVATLGERFFRLAQRLSDRSNYLSLFATHLSHELKTPLTSIQGAAELLRDSGDSMDREQRQRFLQNIVDDTGRLSALSTRLRELARADVADTVGTSDLRPIIEACAKKAGLELELEGAASLPVAMSAENAAIIWKQLAQNAKQHGATGFTVRATPEKQLLRLTVNDNGTPISKANRPQLFDPFFTTRREEGGTGMGLGIAQAMLHSHGGGIDVGNEDGVKFEVWFLGVRGKYKIDYR